MQNREYAQIHYNPDDLDDVFAEKELRREQPEPDRPVSDELEEVSEILADDVKEMMNDSSAPEHEETTAADTLYTEDDPEDGSRQDMNRQPETAQTNEKETADDETQAQDRSEGSPDMPSENTGTGSAKPDEEEQPEGGDPESAAGDTPIPDEKLDEIAKEIRSINYALRRLEKKVETEILNGDNRDSAVKAMYKELNDYKAGLIGKALKNVLYDFVDLREMMISQIKYLREKKQQDMISLEEFESYADDIADILEKHDVTIYKGEAGMENVAVRQKIVRKVETEDESLVKTVAESLSYGYEYNDKILYPEKISIYVKKK